MSNRMKVKKNTSNTRDWEFPEFFGKYPVPGKWHSGTQTSIAYQIPTV